MRMIYITNLTDTETNRQHSFLKFIVT